MSRAYVCCLESQAALNFNVDQPPSQALLKDVHALLAGQKEFVGRYSTYITEGEEVSTGKTTGSMKRFLVPALKILVKNAVKVFSKLKAI